MLFGAIIGDIAGSVYEFANIRSKNFPFMTDRCYVTDDSCMTIAAITGSVAEAYYGIPPELIDQAKTYIPDDLLEIVMGLEDR